MLRAIRILLLAALAVAMFPHRLAAQPNTGKQLYVITYVDVFPNFAAETGRQMQQFADDSRKDPGCVRFEVMRDVERTNHFSIVEVWQDRKSYEAHLGLAHTKTFREKIQPGLGSPFDERLYYLLQ